MYLLEFFFFRDGGLLKSCSFANNLQALIYNFLNVDLLEAHGPSSLYAVSYTMHSALNLQ